MAYPFKLEDTYLFKVLYGRKHMCDVTAHTKFEAVEKVYNRISQHYQNIDRTKLIAIKK
jgi:hypothetical protein